MALYRPRTKPVEARQWNGDTAEFRKWLGYAFVVVWADGMLIENRDGRVVARHGDWIVKDDGFYPIEPALFQQKYEAAT